MTEGEGLLFGTLGGLGITGILNYFNIGAEGLIVMTVMLVIDFCMGLASAKSRGEKIESSKWEGGLTKKILRWALPFIIAGGLHWTGMPGIAQLNTVIMGIIIFAELYSILGHIYSINYGEQLPEFDAFKIMMNKFAGWLRGLTKKELDKIEEEKPNGDKEEK